MYSAVIHNGRVEIEEKGRKRAEKRKYPIEPADPDLGAVAADVKKKEVTITWNDGSTSVHSLPAGEVIDKE